MQDRPRSASQYELLQAAVSVSSHDQQVGVFADGYCLQSFSNRGCAACQWQVLRTHAMVFEERLNAGDSCGVDGLVITNGCTDRTPEVARDIFTGQLKAHSFRETFTCRVINIETKGKINAWNQFVHTVSAPEARFLEAQLSTDPETH